MPTILVTGAFGQVGTDLVSALDEQYGPDSVVASDVAERPTGYPKARYVKLDVRKPDHIRRAIKEEGITDIFHLAALLSASGEKNPYLAFDINVNGTFNILREAADAGLDHVIIPSSMAVFGEGIDRDRVDAKSPTLPGTVYGISKVTAELLGRYFYNRFGLDVRGLRYPGLISYSAVPTAGTTDYAVDMFIHAVAGRPYTCYLRRDTVMPMMYMPDAIDSIIKLYKSDPAKLRRRTDYNVAAFSFSPGELEEALREFVPDLRVTYSPDSRQAIADSWPRYLDSSEAAKEWGFSPKYDIKAMIADMVKHLRNAPVQRMR